MPLDEFGGVAVEEPQQAGRDEFGGIAVEGGRDEFGGVAVQEEAGTIGGIVGSFRRGNIAGQRAIEALQFQDERPSMRQERRAFVQSMRDPDYLTRLMEAGDDPERLARVESLYGPGRRLEQMTEPVRQGNIATAENISDLSRRAEAIPQSAAMQEWNGANNSNWWRVFARNPVEITANIFAESLPQAAGAMASGMVGGAAGGPGGAAAGAGTASFAVEASNALLDAAAKQGVDLRDAGQVRAFFSDESKVKAARAYAMQRGFPIALFDALTAGVAGKFLKPALGQGVARVAGATGLELGAQMAGGAAGETAAQLASGEPLSARDIAAEAIGELVTAPGEVISNLREEINFRPEQPTESQSSQQEREGSAFIRNKGATTPADVSQDALAELQRAMRGNQVPGVPSPLIPREQPQRAGPVAPVPESVVQRVEVPAELTDEQRAAIENQRKLDEAVAKQLANPDKDYGAMSTLDLDLLEGLGDAGAIAESKRRRRAAADASERQMLDDLKAQEERRGPKPREEYAGSLDTEAADSLLYVVNSTQRVAAPPLQPALDAMRQGKTARQVVTEWGGGRGEHDGLVNILEQMGVAQAGRRLSDLGAMRKAYGKAFAESRRPNVDSAFGGLERARETGYAPAGGLPDSPGDLYGRLFDEARGIGQPKEPSPQEHRRVRDNPNVNLKLVEPSSPMPAQQAAAQPAEGGREKALPRASSPAAVPDTKLKEARRELVRFTRDLENAKADIAKPDLSEGDRTIKQEWLAAVQKRYDSAARRVAKLEKGKAQPDLLEQALDKLKLEQPPGFHAFGLVPDLWNRLIEVVRAAYRGGKSAAQAIRSGLDWLKEQGATGYDEASIREHFEEEFRQPSTRQQIRTVEDEMTAHEQRGEAIPQELLDRYKELVDQLGEAIREGRASTGQGRTRATPIRVDRDLQQAEGESSGGGQGPPVGPTPTPEPGGEGRPRRPSNIPRYRGSDRLPHGRLRDLFSALQRWRESTGNWLSRRFARSDITEGRDAGDNRAGRLANENANHERLILNREFETDPKKVRKKNELREAALTFVIEADGDRAMLDEFYDRVSASEHADTKAGRQALAAMEYAAEHWDKFLRAVEEYKTLTATQREVELNEGINSREWEGGYVFHRWKPGTEQGGGGGVDPNRPTPAGTPFRKTRTVPNYAEGIAQGRVPLSLNAVELLAERIGAGQRRLNELRWVHGLRNMTDPVTQEPIVTDVIRRPVRPIQTQADAEADPESTEEAFAEGYRPEMQVTAPAGYSVWQQGDLQLAVKQGFDELLTDLTSKSFFEGGAIRRGIKRGVGFIKSTVLLFDTFHLGRLAAWRQMFELGGGYRKGQTLLDFTTADIRDMVQRGEIPEKWAGELLENKRILNLLVDRGYNVGQVLDNAAADWLHNLPGIGSFNKWLFGQYQRGAMAEAGLIEFKRLRKARPDESESVTARRVARDLNVRFGNLGRQGLFKSRTWQDAFRLMFLAPQWNESLIRAELGALGQLGKVPLEAAQKRRIVAGTLLRATGTMAAGTFLANQILNYAFRGKPTWENDEEGWDKKLSAYIPDVMGNGPGFFLNPLALPMEYTHLIDTQLHKSKDKEDALFRIALSRLTNPARALTVWGTRHDVLGRAIKPGDVLPAMGEALTPLPIPTSTITGVGKQIVTGQSGERYPGQFQKQAMSSFGLKTDQAPSAEQRVKSLAREFNETKGITPSAEFFAGDYDEFTKALRLGNTSDAREALEDVLKKKTGRQVFDHFRRWTAAPFTGQLGREKEFWRSLTPEQRERYQEAREARRKLALQALGMLREAVAK